MNRCNCLVVYGEITENCNVVCPNCGGDMCQHEWENIRKCKGLQVKTTHQTEGLEGNEK